MRDNLRCTAMEIPSFLRRRARNLLSAPARVKPIASAEVPAEQEGGGPADGAVADGDRLGGALLGGVLGDGGHRAEDDHGLEGEGEVAAAAAEAEADAAEHGGEDAAGVVDRLLHVALGVDEFARAGPAAVEDERAGGDEEGAEVELAHGAQAPVADRVEG